ncbi:MAG: ABC transporter substrate-binding protein [Gammaproteobacteria bacterium]|nr:ABC transporter substrate-binding protein [Gammaproteobacteria bacterium]
MRYSNIIKCILVFIALTGCTQKPQPPLIVASSGWMGYQPLFLAEELHYVDKHNISLKKLGSASEIIRGFRNNIVDVATLTLDEAITLSRTVNDFEIILIMDFSHGADAIVARPETKTLSDLNSKIVGVEKTALGAYMLTRALEIAKLDESKIQTRSIEFSRHKEAFLNKDVDAIVTFDPVKTLLQENGGHIIFDSSDIPGEIIDVLITRRSLSTHKQKQLQNLINGWFKSLEYIKNNQLKADNSLARLNLLTLEQYLKAKVQIRLPDKEKNLQMLNDTNTGLEHRISKIKNVLNIPDNGQPLSNNQYLLNTK